MTPQELCTQIDAFLQMLHAALLRELVKTNFTKTGTSEASHLLTELVKKSHLFVSLKSLIEQMVDKPTPEEYATDIDALNVTYEEKIRGTAEIQSSRVLSAMYGLNEM